MSVLGGFRAAREWAYPTLTTSAFLDKGVLTPDEFVKAGDELVYRCPTWAWESGEASKRKSYLPATKQYLITRHVPCQNRVASMETVLSMKAGSNEDDDWLVSTIIGENGGEDTEEDGNEEDGNEEDDFDILDSEGEVIIAAPESPPPPSEPPQAQASTSASASASDDEYADMDAFEDADILEDDAAAAAATSSSSTNNKTQHNSNVVKVRTYDLSITYDKYYQTPRVWMIGRTAQDQPLTAKEMMQDVISDYANKTVTMEHHPHVSGHHASIHPCQHGKVMKAIVRNLMRANTNANTKNKVAGEGMPEEELEGQQQQQQQQPRQTNGPSVEMYLFIFLKFVSSMIPTINYDFTMDVMADTS